MSKKQLHNRLESLFANLQDASPVSPVELPAGLPGWTWEADSNGIYTTCGPQITACLGLPERNFIGQSLFHASLSTDSQQAIRAAFQSGAFPVEIDVQFKDAQNLPVLARITAFSRPANNGNMDSGFHGFVQVVQPGPRFDNLSADHVAQPVANNLRDRPVQNPDQPLFPALDRIKGGTRPLTPGGTIAQSSKKMVVHHAQTDQPAFIAAPVSLRQKDFGVIEIVDDQNDRVWSEEDGMLVQEVANQLSLAIENAELYAAAQLELTERVRAEKETLRRNQDLAVLNEIGQQLSRLTNKQEIFQTLENSLGELIDIRNLTIAQLNRSADLLSFPINCLDGVRIELADRPLGNDIVDYVIKNQKLLRFSSSVAEKMDQCSISLPDRIPQSLIAVPMVTGDRTAGAILIQNFEQPDAFTEIHAELLSTVASQVAIAIENADLFTEISSALQAIEKRERYQANIAQAVAVLTEFGVKGIPEFLQFLGQASESNYVYFAEAREDELGLHWIGTDHWTNPAFKPGSRLVVRHPIPAALFPRWTAALKERGWLAGNASDFLGQEREFLTQRGVSSILLIAVPGNHDIPSMIVFEQTALHAWKNDEIGVLQVAADALSNTYIRQDLLEQLRSSLEETETLYKISHNLALANHPDEMVVALAGGIKDDQINRVIFVLLDRPESGGQVSLRVAASWHSGNGTPPPVEGTCLDPDIYLPLIGIEKPVYYNHLYEFGIDTPARTDLEQNQVQSVAVLPLWASRRQLGAILLLAESQHSFSIREMRTFPPLVDQMATAIDNLRLFEQTQEALAETELYYRISSGIAQAQNSSDLIDLVVNEILPHQAERAAIILFNLTPRGEVIDYELVASQARHGHEIWPVKREPASQFPYLNHLQEETLVVPDLDHSTLDPVSVNTLKSLGVRSAVLSPLTSAGRTIGMILISADQPVGYLPEEIRAIHVASNGISIALERQRLLREAQRRALELEAAAKIARDTTSVLSQDELLERIVNLLHDRFGLYHTAIFLVNQEGTYATIREASGEAAGQILANRHRIPIGARSIIGRVISIGEPVVVNDVNSSSIYLPNPHLPHTQSEMGIPLRIGDRTIGALDIQSTQPNAFREDEVAVLQILADQIAVAIENARAYELAQKAFEEMREVDRLKSQFLANMSHELRTPLNSIIGFSRVILKGIDGPINEMQKQDLNSIYNSGQHLLSLINNVLDLSKIEAGKMELQFEEIHISDIINPVMSTAVGLVRDKKIKLNHFIEPDLPVIVADETRVRQVLLNFISNAAKFTEEGSIIVEAKRVVGADQKEEIMVTVTDTGEGIAAEDTEKLFQPFSQVDDSPTRKTGGTGLGLSICRSFIELHAGKIGLLWSEVGKGSTFYFTLPCQSPEPANYPEPVPALDPKEKIILSIDDDFQVVSLYERFLQTSGYKVVPLTQPRRAVERAKEIRPFAITLDVMMPEVDGWQVIQALKNDPDTRDIPVIMCSILEDEEKGFNLGAADYLVKPFLQEELVNAIFRLNRNGKVHRILVVDDSPNDLRLIKRLVEENHPCEVLTAANGKEALEWISLEKPDVIILDLFMPEMDGFELLEQLRTDITLSRIPVIILTSADLTPDQHQQLADFGQNMLDKSVLREKDFLFQLENILNGI